MASQLHEGATFTIYLPALLAQPAVVPAPPIAEVTETPQEIKGFGRVLIVDDEEAIRMLVEFALSRLGYEVDQPRLLSKASTSIASRSARSAAMIWSSSTSPCPAGWVEKKRSRI